ncbi:MAG: small acid-soluble spore protein Tlp [Thermoanaerobacteraceae bacterium]
MVDKNKEYKNSPKPDDRSDNVEKLQEMIHDTIENYREAENYLKLHSEELLEGEIERIKNKNKNRLTSIKNMREEIIDEVHDNDKK